jgi:hypothetical protein
MAKSSFSRAFHELKIEEPVVGFDFGGLLNRTFNASDLSQHAQGVTREILY